LNVESVCASDIFAPSCVLSALGQKQPFADSYVTLQIALRR
jgi:hypothetical protein